MVNRKDVNMIGRKEELKHLETLYSNNSFEYLVMYAEYEDLKNAMQVFDVIEEKKMMFISKSGYEDSVIRHAKEDGAVLLGIDDLFSSWL